MHPKNDGHAVKKLPLAGATAADDTQDELTHDYDEEGDPLFFLNSDAPLVLEPTPVGFRKSCMDTISKFVSVKQREPDLGDEEDRETFRRNLMGLMSERATGAYLSQRFEVDIWEPKDQFARHDRVAKQNESEKTIQIKSATKAYDPFFVKGAHEFTYGGTDFFSGSGRVLRSDIFFFTVMPELETLETVELDHPLESCKVRIRGFCLLETVKSSEEVKYGGDPGYAVSDDDIRPLSDLEGVFAK